MWITSSKPTLILGVVSNTYIYCTIYTVYDVLFILLKLEYTFPVCLHLYSRTYKVKLVSHVYDVFYLPGRFELRWLLFQKWMLCLCERWGTFGRVMPAEFNLDLDDGETLDVDEVYPDFMQNFQARSARLADLLGTQWVLFSVRKLLWICCLVL